MKPRGAIQITILVENTASGKGILGEHGLSVWIDTGDHRVLFDTGQGLALPHNARVLGIDVATADAIVLSHGHFDHVGGLEWALDQAPGAELHLHPEATTPKFSGSRGQVHRISIPFVEREEFRSGDRRVVSSREPHEVVPGVWATGEIPRSNDFEDIGGPFFLDQEMTRPDPLLDDQSLFLPTSQGLVVIFGCAHAGVINTLDHIERITGDRGPVRLLLGGLHLLRASRRRMTQTIATLSTRQVEQTVFCHCTGARAVCQLQQELAGNCGNGHAGLVLEI